METSQPAKKKYKKSVPIQLTPEQEEEAVDFLKTHEILYNKRLVDYKNTSKREMVWLELATKVGCDIDVIKKWFESQRTMYGKFTRTKSGQAAPELSERGRWLVQSFNFLQTHIQRHKGTSSRIGKRGYSQGVVYLTALQQKVTVQ